jgi:hypothetical protein
VAGYTIKNLKEVEDQAPKFGLSPNLEARFGRVPLECENSRDHIPTARSEFQDSRRTQA